MKSGNSFMDSRIMLPKSQNYAMGCSVLIVQKHMCIAKNINYMMDLQLEAASFEVHLKS